MIVLGILIGIIIGVVVMYCSTRKRIGNWNKLQDTEENLNRTKQQLETITRHIQTEKLRLEQLQRNTKLAQESFDSLVEEQRKQKEEILGFLQEQIQQKTAEVQQLQDKFNELTLSAKEIAGQLAENEQACHRIKEEKITLTKALESLRNQHSIATKLTDYNHVGRVLEHTETDTAAHNVLDGLKTSYPLLREAFANVQWTHIWQKKFQAMTTDIQKTPACGIYRIFTIDEGGRQRSYIGQARDIRERWSQHIKKMCGTLAADNQKFYSNVTPYNAHFEIIEECPENELNEKEHYWISYYNGVSDGYNSRN